MKYLAAILSILFIVSTPCLGQGDNKDTPMPSDGSGETAAPSGDGPTYYDEPPDEPTPAPAPSDPASTPSEAAPTPTSGAQATTIWASAAGVTLVSSILM
jgi:hypothetical protein